MEGKKIRQDPAFRQKDGDKKISDTGRVRRDAKRKNRIVTKKWWQEDEEGTARENFGKKMGAKR
jgi:hypothetical protein